jgi:hypothetical protein
MNVVKDRSMEQKQGVSLFILFRIWGRNKTIEEILLLCEMVAIENSRLK